MLTLTPENEAILNAFLDKAVVADLPQELASKFEVVNGVLRRIATVPFTALDFTRVTLALAMAQQTYK
jgi:hypothetical protein